VPKDVVFLIDTSGSQSGAPLLQCQALMRQFIQGLNPNDTFSIIDFSNTTRQLSPAPLANTPDHRSRAIAYINRLTANGGTNMQRGIQTVLNFPVVEPGRLRSIVLLTDGYIGNENEILADVQRHLQPGNRLYSFGAGSSVNRFLLNRIAEIGRGIAYIIRHDEPAEAVAEKFFRQINNPVLTHIQLRWEGEGEPPIIYPPNPPDLFAEQPLVLFGRKGDRQSGKLQITGIAAGGDRYQHTFDLDFAETGNPAIAQLWGRARIKDLTNQMVSGDTKAGVEAVTDTALTYQLLSQYTAFVAVSDDVRANLEIPGVTVSVPVEMPEAVSHLGVFGSAVAPSAAAPAPAMMMRRARMSDLPLAASAPAPQARAAFERTEEGIVSMESRAAKSLPDESAVSFDAFDDGFAEPRAETADRRSSWVSSGAPTRPPGAPLNPSPIQIVSVTGLDGVAIADLTQYLQTLSLLTGFSGTVVFEFQVNAKRTLGFPTGKSRVSQIVLDDQASTLQDGTMIDSLRRSLLTWRPAIALTGTVRLVLQVN